MNDSVENLRWNIGSALERVAGDEALLNELLNLMVESLDEHLEKIGKCLESGDCGGVSQSSHAIKGAAANLSIEAIRETAQIMEAAGKTRDMATIVGLFPRLRELGAVLKDLAASRAG